MLDALLGGATSALAGLGKPPAGPQSKLTEQITLKNASKSTGAKLSIKTKTKGGSGDVDPLGLAKAEEAKQVPTWLLVTIFALVAILILAAIIFR